jgi:hypothetical protein
LRARAAAVVAGAIAAALIASVGLGQAHGAKPKRVCHRHHHRRVCHSVHAKPTRHRSTTTTTSTSSQGSGTTAPATTTTTTTSSSTTSTQTATTQTTTSSTSSAPPPLPHGTEVDERATGLASPFYALDAYQPTLAAGTVHFNIYNYDQDPHTFAIDDAAGQQLSDVLQVPAGHTGTPVTLTVNLPPGTYTFFCTLPQHAAEGMQTTIVVK